MSGTQLPTTSTTTARPAHPRERRITATALKALTHEASPIPVAPVIHALCAPGSVTANCATAGIHHEHTAPNHAITPLTSGTIWVHSTSMPASVAGAITGAHAAFASTAHALGGFPNATDTGNTPICAVRGIASACATNLGNPMRVPIRVMGSPNTMSAVVAATERMNPADTDSSGRMTSRMTTVLAMTEMPARPVPRMSTIAPKSPMPAARITDGSGPTTNTYPAVTATATPTETSRWLVARRMRLNTVSATSEILDPETAVMWVSDMAFMFASEAASSPEVSPTTRPGRSLAPAWLCPEVSRKWVRRDARTRQAALGVPVMCHASTKALVWGPSRVPFASMWMRVPAAGSS